MAIQRGRDAAQEITDYFIGRLAEGRRPWIKPWNGSCGPLRANGEPYRGMNRLWLDIMADSAGYTSPYWMTFRQANELGGQVRKGERSQIALFYKSGTRPQSGEVQGDSEGEDGRRGYRILRSYSVFNANQVEGLREKYHPLMSERPLPACERMAEIDGYVACIPAVITHGGNVACFRPSTDDILMPPKAAFNTYDDYASTVLHEIGHWTGGKPRLDRTFGRSFGDEKYAAEELTAELYSHLVARRLGLPQFIHDNSAAYIASWIKILQGDKNALLSAAAKAQTAFDFVEQFQMAHTPELEAA